MTFANLVTRRPSFFAASLAVAATFGCSTGIGVLTTPDPGAPDGGGASTPPDAAASPEAGPPVVSTGVVVDGGGDPATACTVHAAPELASSPLLAGCGDGCLVAVAPGGTPRVLAGPTSPWAIERLLGATSTHAIVLTRSSTAHPLPARVVAIPATSGSAAEIDLLGTAVDQQIPLTLSAGNDFYYVVAWRQAFTDQYSKLSLRVYHSATGKQEELAAFPAGTPWFSSLVLAGGFVYVGHEQGIDRVPATGGAASRVTTFPAPPPRYHLQPFLSADATHLYWASGPTRDAALFRMPLAGGTPTEIAKLPSAAGGKVGTAYDAVRGKVLALTSQELVEASPDGSVIVTYPLGASFPQHAGTMMGSGLVLDSSTVYYPEICVFDADRPEYGARSFDLTTGVARWRYVEAGYPLVPNNGYPRIGTEFISVVR